MGVCLKCLGKNFYKPENLISVKGVLELGIQPSVTLAKKSAKIPV